MIKKLRTELEKGVGINIISDKRFKSEYLSLSFMTELKSGENTVSYILPSLLLRGSEKYPSSLSLGRALQRAYDTELSGESYRMGNAKIVRFGVAFLSEKYTHAPIMEEVLDILRQVVLFPLREKDGSLSEKFTELEKNSVIEIIKTKSNNKKSYAFSRCREILLEGDDVGVSKYGTIKDAEALTSEAVSEFYNRMLSNAALEFFYEGSKDPREVTELISKAFHEIINPKSTTPCELGKFKAPKAVPYSEITEESHSEQSILCMGFETYHADPNDFSPRLFAEVLSTSPVSRLFMNIREKHGLCYFCDYSPISQRDRAIIHAGLEYSKTEEAKNAILEEIQDLASGNISDYEFSAAKASLVNAYGGINDSPTSIESWEMACLLLDKYLTPGEVVEKIELITKEDIARVAGALKLKTVFVLKEECE